MSTAAPLAPMGFGVRGLREVGAMQESFFGRLPYSEVFARRYYGRNIDLVAIESAILQAQNGIMAALSDLGREALRNDPAASGMLQKRIGSLASSDWDLTPAQGVDDVRAKQMSNAVRRALVGCKGLRQAIYDLAWAIFDGRAATEAKWSVNATGLLPPAPDDMPSFFADPRWVPTELTWIHPGRLSFGPQRELRVVERHRQTNFYYAVGEALQLFPEGKFVWWMPRTFNDYPEREGLLPRMVYWMFFKRFGWRHRMILTELFGLPWRIIERDKDIQIQDQPEGKDDDVDAAEGLGGTSVASFRAGVKLRVERPDPKSGDFFGMTTTEVNEELRKLVNGQAATMEGDANRASASVARTDEDALRLMDGRSLEERFQEQIVKPLIEMNWGTDALQFAPKFTLRTEPPRDRKSELDRVTTVLGMGVAVSENEIYEISGLRKPMHGETVVRSAAPAGGATQGAGPASGGASGGAGGGASAVPKEENAPGDPQSVVERVLDALDEGLLDEPSAADDAEDVDAKLSRQASHVTLASAQSPYGSVETLVKRGAREGAKETNSWAARLVDAAGGTNRELEILNRVKAAAKTLDVGRLARALERRIVHSLMLGAMDSDWEIQTDEVAKPPAFLPSTRTTTTKVRLDEGDEPPPESGETPVPKPKPEREFATKPFAEAVRSFVAKAIVSRSEFDRLGSEAKRRAFTVANLARDEMVETVHKELTKSISAGEDLRDFKSRLADRFDEAGWTKLNASHVEVVFRNATMSAYSSGRIVQMKQPAALALRPFWQVLGVNDSRTRPSHHALHGKVFPAGAAPQPPFGHNCRCRLVSRSAKDVQRMGLQAMALSQVTGVPDAGWDDSGMIQ